MDRRKFMGLLGLGAAGAAVASTLPAERFTKEELRELCDAPIKAAVRDGRFALRRTVEGWPGRRSYDRVWAELGNERILLLGPHSTYTGPRAIRGALLGTEFVLSEGLQCASHLLGPSHCIYEATAVFMLRTTDSGKLVPAFGAIPVIIKDRTSEGLALYRRVVADVGPWWKVEPADVPLSTRFRSRYIATHNS